MIVTANLTNHFYKQVLDEEEAKKREYETILNEYMSNDSLCNPLQTYQDHLIREQICPEEKYYDFKKMMKNDQILHFQENGEREYHLVQSDKKNKIEKSILFFIIPLLLSLFAYIGYLFLNMM